MQEWCKGEPKELVRAGFTVKGKAGFFFMDGAGVGLAYFCTREVGAGAPEAKSFCHADRGGAEAIQGRPPLFF